MRLRYFIFLIVLISACSKEELNAPFSADLVKIYSGENESVIDNLIITDRGFYVQFSSGSGNSASTLVHFDNDANEQWRSEVFTAEGLFFRDIWGIVPEANGSITYFFEEGYRLRIGPDGEIGELEPFFLEDMEVSVPDNSLEEGIYYVASGVELSSTGNYLTYGYINTLNRGFFSSHSPDGSLIFRKFFVEGLPELNAISDIVELPDGSFILYGLQQSSADSISANIVLRHLDAEGEIIRQSLFPFGEPVRNDIFNFRENYIFTKSMKILPSGGYVLTANEPDPTALPQSARILLVGDSLDYLSEEIVDLSPKNFIESIPFGRDFGSVFCVNQIVEHIDSQDANTVPRNHAAYSLELNDFGKVIESAFVSRREDIYLTGAGKLANGRTILIGSNPFDNKLNAMILLR
ncbi:MAG: hypothetical protein AAGC47_05125 [Bacteroidota bacterium]